MKPTDARQCCGTCIHSRFELTPTGRVRNDASHCYYPLNTISRPIVPDSATVKIQRYTNVWPDDGETCPCFQRIGGEA